MLPALEDVMSGNLRGALAGIQYRYVGWSSSKNKIDLKGLKYGLLPLALGIAVHTVVGRGLGVNRMLARAKIPIFRL
jgi:hypothetical protein